MVTALPWCRNTVVALRTARRHVGGMGKLDRGPVVGNVAVVAGGTRLHVTCRRGTRLDRTATAVTGRALCGRTLENTVYVAAFTLHRCVGTGERKTRCEMIEFSVDRVRIHTEKQHKQRCDQQSHAYDHTYPLLKPKSTGLRIGYSH